MNSSCLCFQRGIVIFHLDRDAVAASCPHVFSAGSHYPGIALPRIEFNAPVTVCYALAALAATILPVQGKLAIHGPIRLLDGDFLLSLCTWTLAHGGMTHLLSNFVVILLAGPLLEDRFGSLRMLAVLVTASVLVGLAHCILDPGDALIGASGTVFCLIMLTAMLAGRSGTIPLTVLLVAALYLGRELVGLFANDGISQTAHILGAALGMILGLVMRGNSSLRYPTSRRS
jgi:membrane associated rhomboid family serine protease